MNSSFAVTLAGLFCAAGLALSGPSEAATRTYKIAHVNHQGSNMVLVSISPQFFRGSSADQNRWYTGIQQCARSANLAGQTLLVTNDNGRYRYFGPNAWHNFMNTIDLNWFNARINKNLTCNF